jgi:hypothetical protein
MTQISSDQLGYVLVPSYSKKKYHASVVALFSKQECHATASYLNGFFTVSTNMDFSLNTSSKKLPPSLAL